MITSKKVRLRKRGLADALDSYVWQTDPELVQLDAIPILTTTFARYLSDYLSEIRYPSPNKCVFAIETLAGKHIGTCSYYNINETKGEVELGIMIGNRDCWGKGYGTDAVTTLLDNIYRATNLNRIYLKTIDSNHRAQRCFKKCGFTPCGHLTENGYNFVLMELYRKQWEGQQIEGEHSVETKPPLPANSLSPSKEVTRG